MLEESSWQLHTDLNRNVRFRSETEGEQIMTLRAFRRNLAVTVAIISLFSFTGIAGATEKTASVEGVVTKIDRDAKTLEVKAVDGTEHTMHLVMVPTYSTRSPDGPREG